MDWRHSPSSFRRSKPLDEVLYLPMLIRSIHIRSNRIDRALRLESGSMMMQRRAPGSPVGFTLYCLYISVISFMKHVIRFSGSIAATSMSKQPNVGPISTSATCVYPCRLLCIRQHSNIDAAWCTFRLSSSAKQRGMQIEDSSRRPILQCGGTHINTV